MNRNTYDISSIKRVTRCHVVVVQNNSNEMYQQVCCTCKLQLLDLLIFGGDVTRPVFVAVAA